jgi:hypothetical protein
VSSQFRPISSLNRRVVLRALMFLIFCMVLSSCCPDSTPSIPLSLLLLQLARQQDWRCGRNIAGRGAQGEQDDSHDYVSAQSRLISSFDRHTVLRAIVFFIAHRLLPSSCPDSTPSIPLSLLHLQIELQPDWRCRRSVAGRGAQREHDDSHDNVRGQSDSFHSLIIAPL